MLVAGVTGGASLIKSAKVNKICNQLTNLRQAWNSYYAQYGSIAGTKSDGSWDEVQVMQDLFDNGLIEENNFNNNEACKYYCPEGRKDDICSGVSFDININDSNGIPDWGDDAKIIHSWEDCNTDMLDEKTNKAIDKKLDDGDPDTGRVRTHKNGEAAYSWEYMCLLLDIF